MKTYLLATTALAAATGLVMISGTANAAEKLKLGVGGYFQAYVGYFDADYDDDVSPAPGNQPAASRRHFDFFREAEIHFNGEVALDNGMKVGVDVQLEAETCGDQIDESYLYFQGDFGKVVLGSENSAAYLMSYGAPAVDSSFDSADPNYNPYGINWNYAPNMTSDSEKITYFSPRFAGFAAGVSWTPDNTEDGGAGSTIPALDDDGIGFNPGFASSFVSDIWELAINFERKFGDFGILAGVTYGFSNELENDIAVAPAPGAPLVSAENQDQWSAGLNVTFAGFTLGGGYFWDDQGLSGDNARDVWAFGGAWANGPLRVGASVNINNDEFSGYDAVRYGLGASYVYAPGMQLRGSAFYWDTDSTPNYEDPIAILFGTVISF